MLFLSDISKFIKEAINPRLNTDENKSLNQIMDDSFKNVKDTLYANINTCKDMMIVHVTNACNIIKDNLRSHITTEANRIRNSIITGESPVIKSVQNGYGSSTTININTVNPRKCIVILNNSTLSKNSSSSGGVSGACLVELTSNRLEVTSNDFYGNRTSFSWQVIEFY